MTRADATRDAHDDRRQNRAVARPTAPPPAFQCFWLVERATPAGTWTPIDYTRDHRTACALVQRVAPVVGLEAVRVRRVLPPVPRWGGQSRFHK